MITSKAQADAQFDANANWYDSDAAARLRLEAVEWMIVHRADHRQDQSASLSFESLQSMAETLRAQIGAGVPRANGRSRTSTAMFGCPSIG